MKNILSFLDRFKNLVRSKTYIEECCEAVFKELLLPLSKEDFEIIGSVLHIRSYSAPLKSEIRLKKQIILLRIKEKSGSSAILDIK